MELETKDIYHDLYISDSKMPKGKKIVREPSGDWWVIYADKDMMPYPIFIIRADAMC